jgi:hypothetical protein
MIPEFMLLGIELPQWAVITLALAVWIPLIGVVFRMILLRAHERLRCPVRHRMARLTLVRGPDGALEDVVRCSLIRGHKPFTCGKICLRSAHA